MLSDGRLFFSHDGSGSSSNHKVTSFATVVTPAPGRKASITFTKGPTRVGTERALGNLVIDPNSADGDLLLIGGRQGAAATTSMERLDRTTNTWSQTPNFFGTAGRINHNTVILPSKQLLVINGGASNGSGSQIAPMLLTPSTTAAGGYTKAVMNTGIKGRLYHANARCAGGRAGR